MPDPTGLASVGAMIEELAFYPWLTGRTRRPAAAREPAELATLTPREREVLDLVVRGRSNAEIARELVIAQTTVKTHLGHVLDKLGLRGRVHAVVYGYEHGLITPGGAADADGPDLT